MLNMQKHMPKLGVPTQFGALTLNSPKGKVVVAQDNVSNRMVLFSDWEIEDGEAILRDANMNSKGIYPVRTVEINGRIEFVIDRLDIVGAQG